MGCSKPVHLPCPQRGTTEPLCIACGYYYIQITGLLSINWAATPKLIHEFTNDELLAEIHRRMRN
jgi:hypothetical protein